MSEGLSKGGRIRRAIALAGFALALTPAAASAADLYVNDDGGSDANPCTQATPCLTIAATLATAGTNDTVYVDNGLYPESVVVGDDKSLRRYNFDASDTDPEGTAVIDPGAATAVEVLAGDPAGTIQGFALDSVGASTVRLGDDATFVGNRIEDGPVPDPWVTITGGSPTITANVFTDPTPGAVTTSGVSVVAAGSPVISQNFFIDLVQPIDVSDAAATITGNIITEAGNPVAVTTAIQVRDLGAGASATLQRNLVRNFDTSVRAEDTTALTMSGDAVLSAPGGTSVHLADTGVGGATSLTATGVTLRGPVTADNGADPTFDSSLLLDPIQPTAGTTCSIDFSRGTTTVPGGDGCQEFDTAANPLLSINIPYKLLNGSPLIDAGNPAPPGPNDAEIDGDQRQIDGNADGIARRDIGADERLYTAPNPTTPIPTPRVTTDDGEGGKKKKKKCKKKKRKKGKKKCGKGKKKKKKRK